MIPDPSQAAGFVLRVGRALHQHGNSAGRVEEVMSNLAIRLGLRHPQIFVTPTAINAAFGAPGEQSVHLLRVEPGVVNLGVLARLDAIVKQVRDGMVSPLDGIARIDALDAAPPLYGPVIGVLGFMLASGATARFLGGGAREIVMALAIGGSTGILAILSARLPALDRVFEPLAAFMASFIAGALAAKVAPFSSFLATLAGLIVLLPGFTLTVALRELTTRHLASGTARLAAATITFLGIIFGVALGSKISALAFGAARAAVPIPLPAWTEFAAFVVVGLALTVILKAEPADAGWVLLAGMIAVLASRYGGRALGPELGAFVGALAVGVVSNLFTGFRNRPSMIMMVPGVLLLVPGSIGYRSLAALLEAEVVSGVQAAFRMFLTAVALVAGLLVANLVTPRRAFA